MDVMARHRRASLPIIVTVLAVLSLTATPAYAAVGSGGGTVEFTYTSEPASSTLPCGKFTSMKFSSTLSTVAPGVEDYTGTYTSLGQTYAGPLQFDGAVPTGHTFYANPAGTFSDSSCTTPTSVPVTAKMTHDSRTLPTVGTSVRCDYTGTFQRVASDYVMILSGACSVNGSNLEATREIHDGVITLCGGGTPPKWCRGEETFVAEPV